MNTDNIFIAESDLKNAQDLCRTISDSDIRSKAVANSLIANIAGKFFSSNLYDIDTTSGLHNIPFVLQNHDISDIYVNGSYFDVRLCFDENCICVPKEHFDNNVLPVAYMFIKLNNDLSNGTVLGFLLPQDIETSNEIDNYYKVDFDKMKALYDIDSSIITVEDPLDISEEDLYNFVDNKSNNPLDIFRKLLLSSSGRKRLLAICSAANKFNFISIDTDTIDVTENSIENTDSDETNLYTNVKNSLDLGNESEFTVTTPSLNSENTDIDEEDISEHEEENAEQIETLFSETTTDDEQEDNEGSEEASDNVVGENRKKASPLLYVLLLALIGAGAFYGINTFRESSLNNEIPDNTVVANNISDDVNSNTQTNEQALDAMPIESVEKVTNTDNKNEAVSVSIPAIENNLDASVLVSNLKVDWEVPSGYASNTSAKRYLIKLGKVIQLNLKTELLLLNRPPITNKITVEIKYNNNSKKFETVGIVSSSGEKGIDDVILQTVGKALNMNISVNTDSFEKLQGNPMLIIKL